MFTKKITDFVDHTIIEHIGNESMEFEKHCCVGKNKGKFTK